MPDFLKHTLFFAISPFMILCMIVMYAWYGEDASGRGWYQDLWNGNAFQWILAVCLAPIFLTLRFFMEQFYEVWEKWSE